MGQPVLYTVAHIVLKTIASTRCVQYMCDHVLLRHDSDDFFRRAWEEFFRSAVGGKFLLLHFLAAAVCVMVICHRCSDSGRAKKLFPILSARKPTSAPDLPYSVNSLHIDAQTSRETCTILVIFLT